MDRRLDDSLELLDDLRLGQDVELTVTATVVGKAFGYLSKGDNADDVASYQVKLKAHSVQPVA